MAIYKITAPMAKKLISAIMELRIDPVSSSINPKENMPITMTIFSLSRSTYSKLMPETKDTASFFSFYDVSEKIAIVIGMFSFGFIEELTGSMRNSIIALIGFFAIGALILYIAFGKAGTSLSPSRLMAPPQ